MVEENPSSQDTVVASLLRRGYIGAQKRHIS